MTPKEAKEILKWAFPDRKMPDGQWLETLPDEPCVFFEREPKKHLRLAAGVQADDGWAIYADADGDIEVKQADPETLEALALWLRDPAAVVDA